jgi:enamine deaminase RidA (YjgF/YER057c/UK114 family)
MNRTIQPDAIATMILVATTFLATPLHAEPAPKKPPTIGMIGLDTSHCLAFSEMLNVEGSPQHVPGGRVTLVEPQGSLDIASSIARVPDYTTKVTALGVELFAFMEAADESKRRGYVPVAVANVLAEAEAEADAKVEAITAAELPRSGLRFHRRDPAAHFSAGVAAPAAPLVWTGQFAASPAVDSRDDVEPAVEAIVNSLAGTLRQAGSSPADLIRLHVAVADDSQVHAVLEALAKHLSDACPAVTVVTAAPADDAWLLVDAVAVASPPPEDDRVHVVGGPGGTAAVMPTGARVFVSGQAAPGEPRAAIADTIGQLTASLAAVGLSWQHVAQIRVFHLAALPRTDALAAVQEAVGLETCPPVVTAIWKGGWPVEIELVAYAPAPGDATDSGEPITFITPPGAAPSAGYTRIVRIDPGPTIWTGGMLAGERAAEGDPESSDVFEQVIDIVEALGGDRRHLVKATYFVTNDAAAASLRRVRATVYDCERPPAASLVPVQSVGRPHRGQLIDMIAVPARPGSE